MKEAAYTSFGIEDTRGAHSALLSAFLEKILSLTERADGIETQFLQFQLRRFRTGLADVTTDAHFQISIDGVLRVTD